MHLSVIMRCQHSTNNNACEKTYASSSSLEENICVPPWPHLSVAQTDNDKGSHIFQVIIRFCRSILLTIRVDTQRLQRYVSRQEGYIQACQVRILAQSGTRKKDICARMQYLDTTY